jgi:hypothetical protein
LGSPPSIEGNSAMDVSLAKVNALSAGKDKKGGPAKRGVSGSIDEKDDSSTLVNQGGPEGNTSKRSRKEKDIAPSGDNSGDTAAKTEKDTGGTVKAEKEESTTALLKRREPIAVTLISLENEKFCARKCLPTPLPPLLPIPALPQSSDIGDGTYFSDEPIDNSLCETSAPAAAAPGPPTESATMSATGLRRKTMWDYVLDEVQWMAVDFRQELRWKLASCKNVAEICSDATTHSRLCLGLTNTIVRKPSQIAAPTATGVNQEQDEYIAQIRCVASALSGCITEFWQRFESKITDQSYDYGLKLRKILHPLEEVSCCVDAKNNSLNTVEEKSQNGNAVSLDGFNEILQNISSMSQTTVASVPSASSALPDIHHNHSGVLQAHQNDIVRQTLFLNSQGYGGIVCGKPRVGKTVAVCQLIAEWVKKERSVAPVVRQRLKQVLLVAESNSVLKWVSEFKNWQVSCTISIWCPPFTVTGGNMGSADVIVVPREYFSEYVSATKLEEEAAVCDSPLFCGVVVDARHVKQTWATHIKIPAESNLKSCSSSSSSNCLSLLSSFIPQNICNRCLIKDSAAASTSTEIESLLFTIPTSTFSLLEKSLAGASKTSTYREQLLSKLSVQAFMPSNVDSMVAAQVLYSFPSINPY